MLTGEQFVDGGREPGVVLLVHLEPLRHADHLAALLLQLRLQPADPVLRRAVTLLGLTGQIRSQGRSQGRAIGRLVPGSQPPLSLNPDPNQK